MTISGAVYREGVAYTPDGAVYVQHTEGASVVSPVVTGTGGSGVPFVLAQSWAAVVGAADTNENALATVTVPANAMGANGALRVTFAVSCNNDASVKTVRVRFSGAAGTIFMTLVLTSVGGSSGGSLIIANRGATNSQVGEWIAAHQGGNVVNNAGATATAAVDTTAATTLLITVQKADGTDTMTLEGYTVELIKP